LGKAVKRPSPTERTPHKPNVAAEKARLFFGKPVLVQVNKTKKPLLFPNRHHQKMVSKIDKAFPIAWRVSILLVIEVCFSHRIPPKNGQQNIPENGQQSIPRPKK